MNVVVCENICHQSCSKSWMWLIKFLCVFLRLRWMLLQLIVATIHSCFFVLILSHRLYAYVCTIIGIWVHNSSQRQSLYNNYVVCVIIVHCICCCCSCYYCCINIIHTRLTTANTINSCVVPQSKYLSWHCATLRRQTGLDLFYATAALPLALAVAVGNAAAVTRVLTPYWNWRIKFHRWSTHS